MASAWLTWSGLGTDRDERKALKRAGIEATDLAQLTAMDLVAATDELIDEERAAHLVRRASLLQIVTPQKADGLERMGVLDRDDLASRSADELVRLTQDASPYTGPVMWDVHSAHIARARGETGDRATYDYWTHRREQEGPDVMRMAWRHRYGDRPEPRPTKVRMRIPAIHRTATLHEGVPGADGRPVPTLDPRGASVDCVERPTVLVGHWQWAGQQALFFKLETLPPGTPLTYDKRPFTIDRVVRGLAPLAVGRSGDEVVLITPPHLRWVPWLRDWDLPEGTDLERAWVQVAAVASPASPG